MNLQKTLAFILLFVAVGARAQTKTPAAQPSGSQPSATSAVPGTNVSVATVESFLRRMFGHDPNTKWRVLDIAPSEVPNVAKVMVLVGDDQRPTTLFVTPDGDHAIVGEVIPFGAEPFAATRRKLDREAGGPVRGANNPQVTLVEFSDLQCPHCKAAQPVIEKIMADYPNAKLVFENFPLANHKWAAQAAAYGVCMAQQSLPTFWNFVQAVYGAQETIPPEGDPTPRLTELARQAGADPVRVDACSKLPATQQQIEKSIDLGRAVGVTGTPTVFINGRKVPSLTDVPYGSLKQLIDFEAQQPVMSQSR